MVFSIHKCAALAPHDSEERGGITHRSKGQSFKSPSDHCHFFCAQRLLINSPNTPHPKSHPNGAGCVHWTDHGTAAGPPDSTENKVASAAMSVSLR
jgi:hypothetical protein